MTTTIIIISIIIASSYILWKIKPIKNSHKIPQVVELLEFDKAEIIAKYEGMHKGHKLTLSREIGHPGYNLFATIKTNGNDLSSLKKIIISWSEWTERIYNFNYSQLDNEVTIQGDEIKIDLGSFNNCESSINFLKRTVSSNIIKIDLLDYIPDNGDFEYEKNYKTQSIFCPILSIKELKKFNKGVHYLNS